MDSHHTPRQQRARSRTDLRHNMAWQRRRQRSLHCRAGTARAVVPALRRLGTAHERSGMAIVLLFPESASGDHRDLSTMMTVCCCSASNSAWRNNRPCTRFRPVPLSWRRSGRHACAGAKQGSRHQRKWAKCLGSQPVAVPSSLQRWRSKGVAATTDITVDGEGRSGRCRWVTRGEYI